MIKPKLIAARLPEAHHTPYAVESIEIHGTTYPTGTQIEVPEYHEFELGDVTHNDLTETVSGKIYAPKPVTINPYVEWVENEITLWTRDIGLTPTEAETAHVRQARFGLLAALCYPTDTPHDLLAHAKLITWLFFHDDLVDNPTFPTAKQHDLLAQLNNHFIKTLNQEEDTPREPEYQPLHRGFKEICEYYRQKSKDSAIPFEPFKISLEQYFQSTENLVKNRENGTIVDDIDGYRQSRDFTSAVETVIEAGLITTGQPLSAAERKRIDIINFYRDVNICVCDNNDIQSVKKELSADPLYVENIVLVHLRIQALHKETTSIKRAVSASVQHLEASRKRLHKKGETLRQTSSEGVKTLVDTGLCWDAGCMFWHRLSGRYR